MLTWTLKHPRMTMEHLGLIPTFLSEDDPRPAAKQIDVNYHFGGGWSPMKGWRMTPETGVISYGDPSAPDADPPLPVLAETRLRNEIILFYESAWVAIVQPDGSFEIARLD